MELRGQEPKPELLRYRLLNRPASWGVVLAAATAAIGAPVLAFMALPLWMAAVGAGGALVVGSAVGALFEATSPLALVTRLNHLREADLKFLGDLSEASPIEQAIVGSLATRWVRRIDNQRVNGEAAYANLEDIIAHAKTLPEDVRQRADKMVALYDATNDHNGKPLEKMTDDQARNLISAFQSLPVEDQPVVAHELMVRYFKGEVSRHGVESHQKARDLYRALRDGMKAVPPVSLPPAS